MQSPFVLWCSCFALHDAPTNIVLIVDIYSILLLAAPEFGLWFPSDWWSKFILLINGLEVQVQEYNNNHKEMPQPLCPRQNNTRKAYTFTILYRHSLHDQILIWPCKLQTIKE